MFVATVAAVLVANSLPVPATTPVNAPAAAAAAPATARTKANPRVCIVDRVTGSMIPLRQCRLLSDWRADGIDPLAKK
jgi:hypothetical protein